MTDIDDAIKPTHREIGERKIEGYDATGTVVLRRAYDTTAEDLWDAVTDPARLARWFLPVSGDLRPGGTYQIEGNAGGEILECAPPRLLRVSWVYGDLNSHVEVRISAEGGQAVLELEHGGVPEGFFEGIGGGWDPAVWALDQHLRGLLPEDLADRMKAGEVPPVLQEIFARTAEEWHAVAVAAGKEGLKGPGADTDS
ncbi:SRPBCC family protein [Actinomadura rugatobispora]|uniref:SRPBCC family protein n=1 Tax=Actinomadura rugatobispora TaxID=1994 RepID=A0ABW1AJN2_9ACTN|nr:SRPBCC family protein [Actinomadura rugatobispora]